LKNVARQALDGEVFVDRADGHALGFEDDVKIEHVRDGTAVGQCGEVGAAPGTQASVDRVVVQVGTASAAACAETLGGHGDDAVEGLAFEAAVRPGACERGVEIVGGALAGRDLGSAPERRRRPRAERERADGPEERDGHDRPARAQGEGFTSLLTKSSDAVRAAGKSKDQQVRESVEQMVSSAFILPLMNEMRDQPLDSDLFHGGFAEDSVR